MTAHGPSTSKITDKTTSTEDSTSSRYTFVTNLQSSGCSKLKLQLRDAVMSGNATKGYRFYRTACTSEWTVSTCVANLQTCIIHPLPPPCMLTRLTCLTYLAGTSSCFFHTTNSPWLHVLANTQRHIAPIQYYRPD
jgi:hypothetical protein